jgi:nucleoid-associated protein YejK
VGLWPAAWRRMLEYFISFGRRFIGKKMSRFFLDFLGEELDGVELVF